MSDDVVPAGSAPTGAHLADAAVRPRRRVDFARWDPIDGWSTVALVPQRVVMHILATRVRDIYGPQKGPDSGAPPRSRMRSTVVKNARRRLLERLTRGVEGDRMTDSQLTYLARIFAWSHVHLGVPNRVATPLEPEDVVPTAHG